MADVAPTIDFHLVFEVSTFLVSFLGGWLLKTLFDRIKSLEDADAKISDQISELRVELPSHYVRRDEFRQLGDALFEALRRIEDKLDRKVDK